MRWREIRDHDPEAWGEAVVVDRAIRTGLPTPIWRKMYQGVPPSKSLRATVEDSVGLLEDRSEVDKAVAELKGDDRNIAVLARAYHGVSIDAVWNGKDAFIQPGK